jgi:hypothetical protein
MNLGKTIRTLEKAYNIASPELNKQELEQFRFGIDLLKIIRSEDSKYKDE